MVTLYGGFPPLLCKYWLLPFFYLVYNYQKKYIYGMYWQFLVYGCSEDKDCRSSILFQPSTEESFGDLGGTVQVVTTLARAEVEGVPSCVSWATCLVCHNPS